MRLADSMDDSAIILRLSFCVVMIIAGAIVASCTAPTPTSPVLASPTTPATIGVKASMLGTTSQTLGPDKLPMDEIFPLGTGNGRDLALNNCIQCHSIIRIVWGPRTEDEWQSVKLRHRERVKRLNDESFDAIFVYLKESFSPDKPYPRLPQWYLDSVNP